MNRVETLKAHAKRKLATYPVQLRKEILNQHKNGQGSLSLHPMPTMKEARKLKSSKLMKILVYCPYSDYFLLPQN